MNNPIKEKATGTKREDDNNERAGGQELEDRG
jgi:hypothetical protein